MSWTSIPPMLKPKRDKLSISSSLRSSKILLNNNNNTTLDMEGYNWMVHNPHYNRAATSQSLTSMPPPPPPAPLSIASDSNASSNSSETLASTSQPKKRGRRPDT